jgi:arginyl-tRNA synthetase
MFNKNKKQGSFGFKSCKAMAEAVAACVPTDHCVERVELSKMGNGPDDKAGFFLNFFLKDSFVQERVDNVAKAVGKLQMSNLEKKDPNYRVLVDFSSPNIAKDMHVGHLRSTIQGDSICRIFEYLGYKVDRVNHVGDWGTQFGMLIQELSENFPNFLAEPPAITDLQAFYKNSKKRFDSDEAFKKKSHENVVKLQSGDEHTRAAWQMLCDVSRKEFQRLYDRMDIKLEEVGESFYNPMLAPLVDELLGKNLAVVDQGAVVVKVGKKNNPPVMLRKSDGGFGYDSTDMAAIRYRAERANRVVYVTDVSQELHFKNVFEGGQKCGLYDPKKTTLNHMMFGMVLQETEVLNEKTGKMEKKSEKMKSRSGDTIKLVELLDEARDRALKNFEERRALAGENEGQKVQIVSEKEMLAAAETLGLSSIKYFDLRQNRTQNYVFDFDKVLDPNGNTGVYLIYAYVRVCSILRKAGFDEKKSSMKFSVSVKAERDLAMTILRLPESLEMAARDLMVNRLTEQLYEISQVVGAFYRDAKVVGSAEQESRITLLVATKHVMEVCFDLLGMKVVTRL